jgi:hypothetical protein
MTFDDLCAEVAGGPGFARRKMFGRDGLLLDGKAVLCQDADGVVFRVGAQREADALAVSGASLWSPMPGGRGPRGWVLVPASESGEWPRLARAAIQFVESGEA